MPSAAAPSAGSVTAPRPAASPWFSSPAFDWLFLLGVPFLTWPLVTAAQHAWGAALLTQGILVTATGHYFATFVRAYGDRELFARYRTRFLLAPAGLLVTCALAIATGHTAALALVTAGWAFWHWLAQAFGFARIYDIKAGSFRPLTAWLDKALVVVGFVGAVTLNPGSIATFGKMFLDAGIGLPSSATFAVVQRIVLGAMVVVLGAYLANLAAAVLAGRPWSWQKQVMHATTIGYYWFAFAWVPNVLVAYVLYELFHDVQYYAITWLTCRQRVRRPEVARWFAGMFRPGVAGAFVFLAAMTALGAADALTRGGVPWLLPVFLTAALLHYYYDGFIWKARERALGKDLGIEGGLVAAVAPRLRHAALWALFFAPLLALAAFGGRAIDERERAESLVAIAPGDFLSQADLAMSCAQRRELPRALEHYRASIAANPDFAQSRANCGAALDLAGDLDGAKEQYEAALRCADRGVAHAQAHVNLGVLLLTRGDRVAAREHLEAGARLGGESPVGRMLGLAAVVPADDVERKSRLYSAILELDPTQLDARFDLGNLLLALGRYEPAAEQYAAVLQGAPGLVPGLVGLASAQAGAGRTDLARETLRKALQREPGNPQALALEARIGK